MIPNDLLDKLTKRQREIADLLAKGAVPKEIGRTLGITPKTVKNHMQRIYAILDVHTQTQLSVLWLTGQRRNSKGERI